MTINRGIANHHYDAITCSLWWRTRSGTGTRSGTSTRSGTDTGSGSGANDRTHLGGTG